MVFGTGDGSIAEQHWSAASAKPLSGNRRIGSGRESNAAAEQKPR